MAGAVVLGVLLYLYTNQSPPILPPATQQALNQEQVLQGYHIKINGRLFNQDVNLRPKFPIKAVFFHSNPAIVKIRMRHPGNLALFMDFGLRQEYSLLNHEGHMKARHFSSSEFIAMDAQGREYDKITIGFVP